MGRKNRNQVKKGQHTPPKIPASKKGQGSSSSRSTNVIKEAVTDAVDKVQHMPPSALVQTVTGSSMQTLPANLSKEQLVMEITKVIKALTKGKKGDKKESSMELQIIKSVTDALEAFESGDVENISVCGKIDENFTVFHIPLKDLLANPTTILTQLMETGLFKSEVVILATNKAQADAFSKISGLEGKKKLLEITNSVVAKLPLKSAAKNMNRQKHTPDDFMKVVRNAAAIGIAAKALKVRMPEFKVKTPVTRMPTQMEDFKTPAQPPKKPEKNESVKAKIAKEVAFKKAHKDYDAFMLNVSKLYNEVLAKQTKDPKTYKALLNATVNLENDLKIAGHVFFGTKEPNFEKFKTASNTAFENANKEFKQHRGFWYKLPELARKFMGLIAAITVIPGVIVAATHGYKKAFFTTPKTQSLSGLEAVEDLMKDYEQGMDASLKSKPL